MDKNIVLPPNFQEEMMNCELEFQHEINETNIRKLIFVYTLGMQYYNLQEKDEFENYYRNKLNDLLLNEKVTTYLDTHKVDLSKKVDLNIFPNMQSGNNKAGEKTTVKKKSNLKKNVEFRDDTEIQRRTSFDIKKQDKIKKEDIIEYVQRKIKEVDIKLQKIDKQVSDNIVDQMAAFEANKRNRKTKKSKNAPEEDNEGKDNEVVGEIQNIENVQADLDENKEEIPRRKRGGSIGQTKLLKEIEEYVEQNMKEMYKALEELKQSYEGEINEAVESGFEEIAESLRSDLKFEEENLTAQYEEERMKQIELIREKHKKMGN
jgi:hypothetical protein